MAFTNIKIPGNRVRIQHGFRVLLFYRASEKKWQKFIIKSEIPVQSWTSLEHHSGIHQILTHSHPEIRQLAKKINLRGFEYFDAWWDLLFELGPQYFTRFGEGATDLWYQKTQPEDPLQGPIGLIGPTGLTGAIGSPIGRLSSKTPNYTHLTRQWVKEQKKAYCQTTFTGKED